MHSPELEKGAKGRQRDRRSLLRLRGRTGRECEITLDSATAGPGAYSGVAARAGGCGPSGGCGAGASAVADPEVGRSKTSGGYGLRTCVGTRAEGHGRAPRANRESALFPVAAEKDI